MRKKAGLVQLDTDTYKGAYYTGGCWIGFSYAVVLVTSLGVAVVTTN